MAGAGGGIRAQHRLRLLPFRRLMLAELNRLAENRVAPSSCSGGTGVARRTGRIYRRLMGTCFTYPLDWLGESAAWPPAVSPGWQAAPLPARAAQQPGYGIQPDQPGRRALAPPCRRWHP